MSMLFKISYGLYVLSSRHDDKDNGCIINTLMQQTSIPVQLSVTVNKANLTHSFIEKSGKLAVTVLGINTPFDTVVRYGMNSGSKTEKFKDVKTKRLANGVLVPQEYAVGYLGLEVLDKRDMGTHTQFICGVNEEIILDNSLEPLTYAYYQKNIKPKPAIKNNDSETYVCRVCGFIKEGALPVDYICPVCKHGAEEFQKSSPDNTKEGTEIKNNTEIKGESIMAKFVCMVCGYVHEGDSAPEKCPICKAPASKFQKQEGEMTWAAEHVVGIASGVPEDIIKDLRANFNGECSEVGMYLAMSRVAFREGYPEVGLYYEKAAYEEAEHAAKFAELLGEVVTDSTKKNLELRVEAENGATLGKTALAKRAKEEGLDAIHDTVHEMARDEARHGKAFMGLLNRYFGK